MKILSYKDLHIWQRGIVLCEKVYILIKKFPKEEKYALSDQMRRAVVSIPSNIAEGYCRKSTKDYLRFLRIAYASVAELETQLIISSKMKYPSDETILTETDILMRMIKALILKLERTLD